MTGSRWMDPPETIRRFTVHQIVQHWAATAFGIVLVLSAAIPGDSPRMTELHVTVGLAGAAFLCYHLVTLIGIGIRHDVSVEKVAFFPAAGEWRSLRSRTGPHPPTGKYSPGEKGDYLAVLAWAVLLAATGIFLRWPGSLGIPGPRTYGWLRVIHGGAGAALAVHVLLVHIPGRWLGSNPALRASIFTGKVPLEEAERRTGWVSDLVAGGILIPVPKEMQSDTDRESLQVRDLLEEGNRLVREGRHAAASEVFEEALRLFPGYSQARYNLGVARMKEGRQELAAEQFRLFVEMDPFNPMAGRARDMLESIIREREGGKE